MTDRPTPDRYPVYAAPLSQHQRLAVEYIRSADWDAHWAVTLTGPGVRRELLRLASYRDARTSIRHHLSLLDLLADRKAPA